MRHPLIASLVLLCACAALPATELDLLDWQRSVTGTGDGRSVSFTRTFSFGAMKVRCGISQFFKRDDAYWTQEFVVIEHDKEVRVALNIVREGTPAPIKWFIDPSPYRVITGTGDGEADMAPAGAVFLMIVPDTGSAPLFTAQDGVFLPSDYTQRKK